MIGKIKHFALKRNDGFTYVEALVGLSVLSIIVMLTPSIMKLFNDISLPEDVFDGDLFIIELVDVAKNADEINLSKDKSSIQFSTERGEIKYRLHNDRVVKSINNQGFVTLMFNVDTFTLKESSDSYEITINAAGGFNETVIFEKR